MDLRSRFRIALAIEGMTIAEFAAAHGVSDVAVHHVLNGKKSKRLLAAMEKFINRQFTKLRDSFVDLI